MTSDASDRRSAFAASLICLALACACAPQDWGLPIEQQTIAGQRLWYLAVPVAGAEAGALDRLVARPLATALERDERVEFIGGLSRAGAAIVFIRSPVSLSSLEVVHDALARVQLPDGSGLPAFGAAGPPGQALRSLATPSLEQLLDRGLGAADLLTSLASTPTWLTANKPDQRPRFDHAIRIQANSVEELADRLRQCLQAAGPKPGDRLPPADQIMRLEASGVVAYLQLAGPDSKGRCRRLAALAPHLSCRPREQMPDAERALLGWPLAPESGLEQHPGGG